MTPDQARHAILNLLKEQDKAINLDLVDALGGNEELFERVKQRLILDEEAEDFKGVGLQLSPQSSSTGSESRSGRGLPSPKLFLSYGRKDASGLARRLKDDLEQKGYEVWMDTSEVRSGSEWAEEIEDGLRSTQMVLALLSPHAVRKSTGPGEDDSVCLDEISFARFSQPPTHIIPVMAEPCEPPFVLFRLDYVDLHQWKDSEEQYQAGLEKLLRSIEDGLDGKSRYRAWDPNASEEGALRLSSFDDDFAPFLDEKRRDFTGRDWVYEFIDDWRRDSRERALLITGDPGVGKSSIVANLVHQNPDGQVLAYHCCRADRVDTLHPARFVQSLAAMIAGRLRQYAEQLKQDEVTAALQQETCFIDPARSFEVGILQPLHNLHAPEQGVRYVLIDALDEALLHDGDSSSLTIVDLLASRLDWLPSWLRVVATTRKERPVLQRLSQLRAKELDAQDPRNLQDIESYITARLNSHELQARLAVSSLSRADALSVLMKNCHGNFLYAQQTMLNIERDIAYTFDDLDSLPPGLDGLYLSFFERHFKGEESYAPIRPVLQCLVAAEEPLSIGQLAEASGLELSEELPRQVRKLSSFIRQQNHPAGLSGGKLTLYHKSITDWLTNPDRCSDIHFISKREGHRRLANSCWQEYQDFITHWKPAERYPANRSLSDYSLRHLATHLTAIQSWEGLETILTDLRWVEARALTGQVFELLADYSHSLGSLPELQTERQETVRRQQELRDYAKELIEYARYQIDERLKAFEESEKTNLGLVAPEGSLSVPTPPAPPDTRPIQEDMIQAQAAADQPSGKKLSRENQVRSFSNFVSQFCHRLANFPEQTVTSAVNHAVDGPVTKQAEELVRLLSQNWFFRRPRPPSYCDRPLGALCLEGHTDVVSGVDMTSDGALAVSSSWDGTVRLWNPTDGKCLRVFRGHEGWVNDVAMTPDGTIAVSVGRDETMKVWEMNTGQCLFSLRGHRSELRGVGLSADGRIAVSSSADKTLRVWDLRAGVCLNTLEGHTHAVNAVAVSADGCTAVSASDDKTVRVWDTFSGQCLRTLTGHEEKVLYVSLSANGYRMVSGDTERGLLWNPSSGECLDTMKGLGGPAVLTPDCLSVVAPGPWVSVFDIQQRRKIRHFRAHNQMPMAVAVTADGTTALTGTWDKILHKWDLQRGRIKQQAGGHEAPILGLAKTRDAGVISVDYAGLLCIWDSQGNVRNKIRDSEWAFTSVALDREGRLAVTGCLKAGNPSLCIWDLQKEVCIHTIEGHSDLITAVTFHSDGNSFISASYDKTLRVWDLESGKTIRILEGHKDMVSDLAITPDGSLAVSASHDETIRIWCVADGQCVRIIEGHTDWIYKMAFTPEGDKVISAGKEPKLYVWDFHTGQLVRTIEGHTESVRGLAVTPCGNHLVSSSDDCTLRFWDIKTGKCLALYVSDIPVDFLAIPTPGRIVGGSADGQMHFLDLIMPHMTN